MAKYRKKPITIEAFRMGIDPRPNWFQHKVSMNEITTHPVYELDNDNCHPFKEIPTYCLVKTLEGVMKGDYGDYIIQGVTGEVYPCKPDVFNKTYDYGD